MQHPKDRCSCPPCSTRPSPTISICLTPVGFLAFFHLPEFGDFCWEWKSGKKAKYVGPNVEELSRRKLSKLPPSNKYLSDMHLLLYPLIKCLPLSTWLSFKIHWGYFCTIDFKQTSGSHVAEHSLGGLSVSSPGHSQWLAAIGFLSKYADTTYSGLKAFLGHLTISRITKRKVPMVHTLNCDNFF